MDMPDLDRNIPQLAAVDHDLHRTLDYGDIGSWTKSIVAATHDDDMTRICGCYIVSDSAAGSDSDGDDGDLVECFPSHASSPAIADLFPSYRVAAHSNGALATPSSRTCECSMAVYHKSLPHCRTVSRQLVSEAPFHVGPNWVQWPLVWCFPVAMPRSIARHL